MITLYIYIYTCRCIYLCLSTISTYYCDPFFDLFWLRDLWINCGASGKDIATASFQLNRCWNNSTKPNRNLNFSVV